MIENQQDIDGAARAWAAATDDAVRRAAFQDVGHYAYRVRAMIYEQFVTRGLSAPAEPSGKARPELARVVREHRRASVLKGFVVSW